jgi:hypothetical protein
MIPSELALKSEALLTPHLGVTKSQDFASTLLTHISLILDEGVSSILLVIQELEGMLHALCTEAKREDAHKNIDSLMRSLAELLKKYTDNDALVEKICNEQAIKDFILDNIRQDKGVYSFNIEVTNRLHVALKQQSGMKEIDYLAFHHLMTLQIEGYFDLINKKYSDIEEQIDDWINLTLQSSMNEQLIAQAQNQLNARDTLEHELKAYIQERVSSIKPELVFELVKRKKEIIDSPLTPGMADDDKKKLQFQALYQVKEDIEQSLRDVISTAIQVWCSTKPIHGLQIMAFERILSEELMSLEIEASRSMAQEQLVLQTPSISIPATERGPLINFLMIAKSLELEFLLSSEYNDLVIRKGELRKVVDAFQDMMSMLPIHMINHFKILPKETFLENLAMQCSQITDLILSPRQFNLYQQAMSITMQLVVSHQELKTQYEILNQKKQESKQLEKERYIQQIDARPNTVSEPQVRTLIAAIKHGKTTLFHMILKQCNTNTLSTVLTQVSSVNDKDNLLLRIQERILELEKSPKERRSFQAKPTTPAASIRQFGSPVFSSKTLVAADERLFESRPT